jgi:hypothetical protein
MRFLVLLSLIALLALPAVGNACDGNPGQSTANLSAQRNSLAAAHPAKQKKPKHAAKRYGYR